MRSMVLISFLGTALSTLAQTWCAAGATWHYSFTPFGDGYAMYAYAGDTLIEGWPSQRIQGTYIVSNVGMPADTTHDVLFTRFEEDVVYAWSPGLTPAWDTLYWFDAVPGDRWWPRYAEGICPVPWGMLEVVDTGTVQIEGVPLRTQCLSYLDEQGESGPCFEVIERIGSEIGLSILPGGCIVVEGGLTLRCYSDEQIPLYTTGISPSCDFLTTVQEQTSNRRDVRAYPNPGNDRVRFHASNGSAPVWASILDARGVLILDERLTHFQDGLDVGNLQPGLYTIRLQDTNGRWVSVKWMKA